MTLLAVPPLHNRAAILASLHPRLWYWQHLQDDRTCWCSVGAPDQTCDTGEALWRLARAPEKRTPVVCPRCGVVHGRSAA